MLKQFWLEFGDIVEHYFIKGGKCYCEQIIKFTGERSKPHVIPEISYISAYEQYLEN